MPRLIIHPGAPKTGTSTLQRFLHAHREALLRRGVAVYTPANFRRAPMMRACRSATRGGPPLSRAALDAFAAETADADIVLVSEEGFCSGFLLGGEPEPSGLERAGMSAEVIGSLPFDDIRVILTIRQQRGFLVSSYTHRVKLHREARGFSRWLDEAVDAERLSWSGVASAFEARLGAGRVALLPFEIVKAESAVSYVRAFFAAAGLSLDDLDLGEVRAANVSASHLAVSASRVFNRLSRRKTGRSELNAWLTRRFPSDRHGGFRPSDPRLDEIANAYAAENDALARRYFPDHADVFLGARS